MNIPDFSNEMFQFLFALPPKEFLESVPVVCSGNHELTGTMLVLHSGLADPTNPTDPTDPVATGAVLRARLAGSDPDTAVRYVQLLASLMHVPPTEAGALSVEQYEKTQRDSTVAALSALEGFLGITTSDYPPADGWKWRLSRRLRHGLARVSEDVALTFLGVLAGSCSHNPNRGTQAALGIIEVFFGLSAGQYTPDVIEICLGPWCRQLSIGFCTLLAAWGPHLKGVGREAEARALLGWIFQWTDTDLQDGQRLAAIVRSRLNDLPPDCASMISIQIPVVMHQVIPRPEVLRFIESVLGIEPKTYWNSSTLMERLCRQPHIEHEYLPDTVCARIITLLQALANARESERGLLVLRAIADIPSGPSGVVELTDQLQEFICVLPVHHRAEFNKLVATTLYWAKEFPATIRQLEGVFSITPNDYADPVALAGKLRYTTQAFSPEEPVALTSLLMGSLSDDPQRDRDTLAVADACLWRVLDIKTVPLVNAGAVLPVCMMLDLWLALSDAASAYQRLGDVVAFLRQCLDIRGFHLEDRERFIRDVATLRRRVVQVGYQQAGTDPDAIARLLGWDVELGQRLLFERYRFHRPSAPHSPRWDSADVSSSWSLDDDPLDHDDYLPPDDTTGPSGRFGHGEADVSQTDLSTPDLADAPDGRCQMAANILRAGTSAEQVASTLGSKTMLLRAGFLSDGRLFWRVFRSDGSKLTCVTGETPNDPTAASEIAAAVAWHDRLLETMWAELGRPVRPLADWCRELQLLADDLRTRLTVRRGTQFDPDVATRTTEMILTRCREAGNDDFGFGDWFRSALPANWSAVTDRRPWADAWASITDTLRELASASHAHRLDAATAAFLRRVAARWDLSTLRPYLTPEVHLVVEVEDQLHGVPVAFLPTGGKEAGSTRLFQHTRSVRSSLSLLLTLLHGAEAPSNPLPPNGLLTVSWFASGDPARQGARWLHHGQQLLARRHGCTWSSASDHPVGQGGAIARGLATNDGVRVLAVCGHGRVGGPGVCLSDGEAWAGENCDLRRVTWILTVSCCIGRLAQQPGVPDVEGFTAALLARRARAALACRWPVHALQAAGFANAVADEYLAPDRQTGQHDRATALARARKRFFEPHTAQRAIGLNTAAAFDLYGEG